MKDKMKHIIILISSFCFVINIAISCKNTNTRNVVQFVDVKILEAVPNSINEEDSYVGTVEESFGTTLSFETAGNVLQLKIKDGQFVNRGQVLATLNQANAQNAYNFAKATLERAEDGYKRSQELYNNRSLSEIKWVEIETGLMQAQSAAAIAKKNLSDCKLVSPISGVISSLKIEQGMNVIPYQPVAKVIDIEKLNVSVSIPENEISQIKVGQEAEIYIAALDNEKFDGVVAEKGIEADVLSHCYKIKILISNDQKKILPGMVAKVQIKTEVSQENKIQVPTNAVQISNDGQKYLWIAKNGCAHRAYINTGKLINKNVVVEKGIEKGDSIIIEGWQKVSENSKLTIVE